MPKLTTNPNAPGRTVMPDGQNKVYLVLSEEERAKGFVRAVRERYKHVGGCGTVTIMGRELAETYARDPKFYDAAECSTCGKHFPVAEFVWNNTNEVVGS